MLGVGRGRVDPPIEYWAHVVARRYRGMTWRDVMQMRPRDIRIALEFFALDADLEKSHNQQGSGHAGKAPARKITGLTRPAGHTTAPETGPGRPNT